MRFHVRADTAMPIACLLGEGPAIQGTQSEARKPRTFG